MHIAKHDHATGAPGRILQPLRRAACCAVFAALPGLSLPGGAAAGEAIRFDFEPLHVNRPARGAEARMLTFAVERCAVAPQIDGLPADACWQSGAELSDFVIPTPPTRARFCYDDRALYILMQCDELKGREPRGVSRPRDASLQADDNIHFVISPAIGSDVEHLFRINIANSIYDARQGDETWNPEWLHAVTRSPDGWRAEIAIPFAALGLPAPPPALGFNIGRSGPDLQIRSWFITMHVSTAASALILKGVPAAGVASGGQAGGSDLRSSANVTVQGTALAVDLPRAFARPQDRWIDATLTLAPRGELPDTRIEAKLFALGGGEPLASGSASPASDCGRVSFDLRAVKLDAAEVTLEYFEGAARTGLARMFLTAQATTNALVGRQVPVLLDAPRESGAVKDWPVVFGVPFARGALWDDAHLRLVDKAGREIPCQKEITARWAKEGSIQWVRFDALVNSSDGCFLEAAAPAAVPPAPVRVSEQDGQWVLETGVAKYVLSRGISPIAEVWLGGARLAASAGTRGLYVVDQDGRTASAATEGETVAVEAQGPVAACVRFEGFYRTPDGQPRARHITRVEAFAGQPFARVTHTLVMTEDTRQTWFKEVGWEFAVAPGPDARAVFNVARAASDQTVSQPLAGDASAYMLQQEHQRFGAGTNRFVVSAAGRTLAAGDECGDWAMLAGRAGGLLVACKEAARQHPKEFEVFAGRVVLKLFSNRAGEELDFRPAALARKWNLQGKIADDVARVDSDAAGWAKTHELLLAPMAAPAAAGSAARLAALHAAPIYALVDPEWMRMSEALGPLHPRDSKRFPEAERLIDNIFQAWGSRGHEPGHYGFMDYFAGPTYSGGSGLCGAQRYRYTYGLRSGVWLLYARSGERAVRAFAEGSNKAYLDNYLIHGDVPGKVRGVYTGGGGKPLSQLPFYWGEGTAFQISSSTDLNQFLWLYHLAGYRRAKDAVVEFGEGLKRGWRADMRTGRVLMVFRALTQCYGFTWDPRLRALAEGTFDAFVDREGELLLTKNRPYGSSSYKTQVDLRGIIEGWRCFGEPKYREAAMALARHWWNCHVGTLPVNYMNPLGFCGDFLYQETGDPAIPAGLDFAIRRAASHTGGVGASAVAAVIESLPYAMDVVARAPRSDSAWISYRDYGSESSVLVHKPRDGILDLTVRAANAELGRQFALRSFGIGDAWGGDLTRVTQRSAGAAAARVPKDAPAGCYGIVPAAFGEHFVMASAPAPMVLHARNYWSLPELAPAPRIHFRLPEGSAGAQIFFEGRARLFEPAGNACGDTNGVRGWVDLPADKPGLWSFEPIENRLVRGRNFPPFYAFGDPSGYFEPPIAWEPEPVAGKPAPPPAAEVVYVPGAIAAPGNQALHLGGKRAFRLEAGPAHPSGDGGQFLPYKQGTIEFFFKPYWSTFDLGAGDVKRSFVRVLTDKSPWNLMYRLDPEGVNMNLCPPDPSHSFFGEMYLNTPGKPQWLRVWRTQTILERAEWVHVVWSWGPEVVYGPHREKLNLMTMRIFVNGRGVRWVIFRTAVDALAEGRPQSLIFDPVQGAVDELRISDVQRYPRDFTPPLRDREFTLDENTRALFHFDGNLEGGSHGPGAPAAGYCKITD